MRVVLQPGSIVAGKYRVERILGAGGMGAVYVAINVVLEKRVALKVMSGGFDTQPHAMDRFFREAMSASRVRHPAIVEIYDAGMHEGAPWMAMELLEGESLAQRIERGVLVSIGELLPIFGPVLSALGAVHAQGIVHRDLKPDNIFLERLADGHLQPKILDFGIAKTQGGLNKLTATGAVMGTAHYLAPEQARDSSTVDPRTDLYAIGVVVYESLSGRMPHDARTLPELISKLLTEDPVPLLTVAPHVPVELANVVHWCLARDPRSRPQHAAELVAHLQRVLVRVPSTNPSLPVVALPASSRPVTGTGDPLAGSALAAAAGPRGPVPTQALPPASAPGIAAATDAWSGASPTAPMWSSPPSPSPPPLTPSPWSAASSPVVHAPPRRSSNTLLFWILGLGMLGMACLFTAPFLIAALGVATSLGAANGSGGGGGGVLGTAWPRWWESWRMPFIRDVNGDGHGDVVGWGQQIVGSDLHELLCAYDGVDGEEIWCADVGEEDDLSDAETALVGDRIVHFTGHGRASAFELRDGARLDWQASVRGEPEEVCAIGTDRVGVRTPDRLWSILTIASGRVELAGEAMPADCGPAAITSPPLHLSIRVTSPTWKPASPHAYSRAASTMSTRLALESFDRSNVLLIGAARGQGRNPGAIALVRGADVVWQQTVPSDPLRAQAQPPEAVAITDDLVLTSYEMTARGDAPRHMAAFRLADGQRVWDVALPNARGDRAWYLVSDGELAVVSVDRILIGLDAHTGEARFQIGEHTRRH